MLLNSCVGLQPTMTVDELNDRKDGTYLAINIQYDQSYQKSCWFQIIPKTTAPPYNIDLSYERDLYILEIIPGSYSLGFDCYGRNYSAKESRNIQVLKDRINFVGKVFFSFKKISHKDSNYSVRIKKNEKMLELMKEQYRDRINESSKFAIIGDDAGLSHEEILNVLRANLDKIRECYEEILQIDPNVKGEIHLTFVIGKNGKVKSVTIKEASIKIERMQNCVMNEIEKSEFPMPRNGADVPVNYPFWFEPLE